jgi:hypothetical protein
MFKKIYQKWYKKYNKRNSNLRICKVRLRMEKDLCELLEKCHEALIDKRVLEPHENPFCIFDISVYKNESQENLKKAYKSGLDIYFTDIKKKKSYKLNEQGLLDEVEE